MINIVIFIIIIFLIFYFITTTESLQNIDSDSYYIDSSGYKHEIKNLPLTVNNITELKYISYNSPHVKFLTTKGSYNKISTESKLQIINNDKKSYQLLHIQNKSMPFSGTLF